MDYISTTTEKIIDVNNSYFPSTPSRPGYCPEICDKYLCWPEVLAGTIVNKSCPPDYEGLAYKECWSNGSWYMKKDKLWTNYTQCINIQLEFLTFINRLHLIGYSVSLATLLISLWIFIIFRSLRCTRIKIHIQLFTSFVFNNIAWILFYVLIIFSKTSTLENNPIWCQFLHIAIQYFMLANYFWMFCEGLHLHLALAVVFVREEVTLKWFFGIGWGIPLVIVKIYALHRIYGSKDTGRCWMDGSNSNLILSIPVLISLLASVFFLINVLRVILTIMHPNSLNPAPLSVRRAARAAIILIPLFGLHHFLLPYTPERSDSYHTVYLYISAIIIPFQGLCVSCIFCFANKEVHQAIKSFIHRRIFRDSRWSNYQYTGAVDSAGVYVVNGNSTQSNTMALLSLRRKSTTSVRL